MHDPIRIYLELINYLISYEKNGRKLYIEDKKQIHFKPSVFKSYLKHLVGDENEKAYLRIFRLLELIVVRQDDELFTNTKRIKGKLKRVITIYKPKFEELEKLVINQRGS